MKKYITIFIISLIAVNTFAFQKMEEQYQHDADIYRLRHMKYYSELIIDYYRKTGKYPLQGESEYQHYVYIAAPHQQKYVRGGPPYKHTITDIESFRKILKTGLEKEIEFKFDPQKVPVTAPNFYIYMIQGDSFFFAVHLYNEYSFASTLDKHYNKLEITNKKSTNRGLWEIIDLLENSNFQVELNKQPHRTSWFNHLENQYK